MPGYRRSGPLALDVFKEPSCEVLDLAWRADRFMPANVVLGTRHEEANTTFLCCKKYSGKGQSVDEKMQLPNAILDKYLAAIGKPKAPPQVRKKIETAVTFFAQNLNNGKVTDETNGASTKIVGYLTGIDFSKSVELKDVSAGTVVTQYSSGRLGNWFSLSGRSTQDLGISGAGRSLKRYVVTEKMKVLWSSATSTSDIWTKGRREDVRMPWQRKPDQEKQKWRWAQWVSGGGTQLVIPESLHVKLRKLMDDPRSVLGIKV